MLTVLNPFDSEQPFPDVSEALTEPNGLLAVGGCLSTKRIVLAYRNGIFPWFGDGEPILWWSPDPRMVLWPHDFSISRSLRKSMRKAGFSFSYDTAFGNVVAACAGPRPDARGTWITVEMMTAYRDLHRLGFAHSFEAWVNDQLVGGLFGVAIGKVFYGESMFHRIDDASKAALAFGVERLNAWGYELIDCQLHTSHLASLGAQQMSRQEYLGWLKKLCDQPVSQRAWALGGEPG